MSAGAGDGSAMTYAQRAAHMRAWFKRWRREFRVFELPRLEPVKLGALADRIGWRVTTAHCAEFAAFEALRKHVHACASTDPALEGLVADYFNAVKEAERHKDAIQMLERAELDYLRGMVWPGMEDRRQVLPAECDRLHEWFRE